MKRRNREVKVQTAMGRDSAGKASSVDAAEGRSVESIIFGDPITADDILGDKASDAKSAAKGAKDAKADKDAKDAAGAKDAKADKDAAASAKDAKAEPSAASSTYDFMRDFGRGAKAAGPAASAVDSATAAAAASADKPDYGDIPDVSAPEGGTTKPADPGFMSGTSAYKAYGEPLEAETPDEFSELEAMEELLSGSSEVGQLPLPEVFNAYPPEVQRKIMEWTDRDVRARRDDESRRKDELVRAQIERERRKQSIPAIIIVVSILCGTVLGFVTGSAWLAAAFLIVPIAVIVANFASGNIADNRNDRYRKPPQV